MKQRVPTQKTMWQANLTEVAALLHQKQTFLFSADIDPDSVGSMLSLALYLRERNKTVYMVLTDSLGGNLDYLEKIIDYNSIRVLRNTDEISRVKDEIETVIFCDTANTKLIPFFPFLWEHLISKELPVIEIDHHFGADSETMADHSITLFRNANSTTEITAELLRTLYKKYPEGPNPMHQRNILISLLTGILGDTVGGRQVPFQASFEYWMDNLGDSLGENTRWRKSNGARPGDDPATKFGTPWQILDYLDQLSEEQHACMQMLKKRLVVRGRMGFLNLLNSTYVQVKSVCRPYNSPWFTSILANLLNEIPDEKNPVGMVYFHGKNAEDKDCIYIKMRRAKNSGIDLRKVENPLRTVFDGKYMGGGGHAGAVSFRVHPHDEHEFLAKFERVVDSLSKNLV